MTTSVPPQCPIPNSFQYNSILCSCNPGYLYNATINSCTLFRVYPDDWVVGSGVDYSINFRETIFSFDLIKKYTQSQAVFLEATLFMLVIWLLFCFGARYGSLGDGRTPWFKIRWRISRLDICFATRHWLVLILSTSCISGTGESRSLPLNQIDRSILDRKSTEEMEVAGGLVASDPMLVRFHTKTIEHAGCDRKIYPTPLSEIDISSFRPSDLDSNTLFDPNLLAAFEQAVMEVKAQEAERRTRVCQEIKIEEEPPLKAQKIEEAPNPLLDFEEKCPPGGSDSVILYTTGMRGIRKTFENLNRCFTESCKKFLNQRCFLLYGKKMIHSFF